MPHKDKFYQKSAVVKRKIGGSQIFSDFFCAAKIKHFLCSGIAFVLTKWVTGIFDFECACPLRNLDRNYSGLAITNIGRCSVLPILTLTLDACRCYFKHFVGEDRDYSRGAARARQRGSRQGRGLSSAAPCSPFSALLRQLQLKKISPAAGTISSNAYSHYESLWNL